MTVAAAQIQYRDEYIHGFEARQSLLRDTVTTEAVIKGNQAIFLVADSGGATTTTRGQNGRIPARSDNNTQNTCNLTEEHDKVEKTAFNIFASQGDQNQIMQNTSMGVVNRKIDDQIIVQLNTATINTGATAVATVRMFSKVMTTLGNAEVPQDGMICNLITPGALAYLTELAAFSSADYVSRRPLETGEVQWDDKMPGYYVWMGMKFIVHPNLPGVGTSAEKCFAYHENSIGHAINIAGIDTAIGYNDEDDYSYARTSFFGGAKLLQNSGVVVINHDSSALQLTV